jgi:hypothetical protein
MTEYDPLSLRRAIAELERWAEAMVLWFKPQRLPLPVITIQGGQRNALGWFAWSRWESRDGAVLDEINFVPEHLGRDVFDIAETLLHELVHLANYTAGMERLPARQKWAIKLRGLIGLSLRAAARVMGIRPSTFEHDYRAGLNGLARVLKAVAKSNSG